MAAGFLKIPYESIVLPYNDEKTPIDIMGVKMLPILVDNDFKTNESLVIIKHIDATDRLRLKELENSSEFKNVENYLNELGSNIHSLAMPYWIYTKEFDESSRAYFQSKKEIKRGPFKELIKNKSKYINNLNISLAKIDGKLSPFYQSSKMTIYDILIASHLWGMYTVAEYQFPVRIHQYLQQVSQECNFDYHEDFWR